MWFQRTIQMGDLIRVQTDTTNIHKIYGRMVSLHMSAFSEDFVFEFNYVFKGSSLIPIGFETPTKPHP